MNHRMGVPFLAALTIVAPVAIGACRSGSTTSNTHAAGDAGAQAALPTSPITLLEARRGFVTHVRAAAEPRSPPDAPPPKVLSLVHYPSPVGDLAAYLTPDRHDGGKHAAILWMIGGFSPSISDTAWAPAPADNDQSARAFREAGLVMMYPSVRGANDNPGHRESYYGEVDDVVAAADYLASLPYVDPKRIYLGGHSTGGTMALLVAEATPRFRAVFAFGPVASAAWYGQENVLFDVNDKREVHLRAPMAFASTIRSPTFMIEGEDQPSNGKAIPTLLAAAGDAPVHGFLVPRATHFSVILPVTRLLAKKITADTGPACEITLTDDELRNAMGGG